MALETFTSETQPQNKNQIFCSEDYGKIPYSTLFSEEGEVM